jgi:hypothetical protein
LLSSFRETLRDDLRCLLHREASDALDGFARTKAPPGRISAACSIHHDKILVSVALILLVALRGFRSEFNHPGLAGVLKLVPALIV